MGRFYRQMIDAGCGYSISPLFNLLKKKNNVWKKIIIYLR